MRTVSLELDTPRWALPLLEPARYKGAHGGRASGKSHFMAEALVEAHVSDPSLRSVCIREVQRSLKFSAKSLIEAKIRKLGVDDLFEVVASEIRRKGGTGVIIFEGMQDHTADSIKSLEGFRRAWVEEAQSLSKRSLDLLIPTIRADDAELWFSWNPEHDSDPVDQFLRKRAPDDSVVVEVNYRDNPWCPEAMKEEAERVRRTDPDAYAHVWMGGYNVKSDALVLSGKTEVDEFEPTDEWDGPYYGADWGYSQDPTAIVRFWVADSCLWVEHEAGGVGVDLQDTPALFDRVPGSDSHRIRADAARPETIAYMRRKGYDVVAAPKWSGSVEDGVAWLRSHERIIIHPRCKRVAEEARQWSYKTDRRTGDPLPKLADGWDHYWDAIRYGAAPMIRKRTAPRFRAL